MTYEELSKMVFHEVADEDCCQDEEQDEEEDKITYGRHDCGYCMYCLQVSW